MKKEIDEIIGMLSKLSDAIHLKTNGNGYDEEVMVRDITIKLNSLNIDGVVKAKRTCPKCGSDKIIMFTSDLDICQGCGQQLDGA